LLLRRRELIDVFALDIWLVSLFVWTGGVAKLQFHGILSNDLCNLGCKTWRRYIMKIGEYHGKKRDILCDILFT
jgi:hypothetical protein